MPKPYKTCTYCNIPTVLTSGEHGYIWTCECCGAFIGCHKGTTLGYGTVADASLREARHNAHKAFQNLIDGGVFPSKTQFYKFLGKVCCGRKEAHIGVFNKEQCETLINICDSILKLRIITSKTGIQAPEPW